MIAVTFKSFVSVTGRLKTGKQCRLYSLATFEKYSCEVANTTKGLLVTYLFSLFLSLLSLSLGDLPLQL